MGKVIDTKKEEFQQTGKLKSAKKGFLNLKINKNG